MKITIVYIEDKNDDEMKSAMVNLESTPRVDATPPELRVYYYFYFEMF